VQTISSTNDLLKDIQPGPWSTGLISGYGYPQGGGYPNVNQYPQQERNLPNAANGAEYPDNNPKTAVAAKKLPLEVVPPSAVHALAEAFSDGAKKYGPYNWREKTISSSVYYGAALRHITAWWDGEDLAEDSGIHHLHHALACIAMVIDGMGVGKLNDNRPPKGAASQMQKAWVDGHSGT
jgi:hypothetical protein